MKLGHTTMDIDLGDCQENPEAGLTAPLAPLHCVYNSDKLVRPDTSYTTSLLKHRYRLASHIYARYSDPVSSMKFHAWRMFGAISVSDVPRMAVFGIRPAYQVDWYSEDIPELLRLPTKIALGPRGLHATEFNVPDDFDGDKVYASSSELRNLRPGVHPEHMVMINTKLGRVPSHADIAHTLRNGRLNCHRILRPDGSRMPISDRDLLIIVSWMRAVTIHIYSNWLANPEKPGLLYLDGESLMRAISLFVRLVYDDGVVCNARALPVVAAVCLHLQLRVSHPVNESSADHPYRLLVPPYADGVFAYMTHCSIEELIYVETMIQRRLQFDPYDLQEPSFHWWWLRHVERVPVTTKTRNVSRFDRNYWNAFDEALVDKVLPIRDWYNHAVLCISYQVMETPESVKEVPLVNMLLENPERIVMEYAIILQKAVIASEPDSPPSISMDDANNNNSASSCISGLEDTFSDMGSTFSFVVPFSPLSRDDSGCLSPLGVMPDLSDARSLVYSLIDSGHP